MNKLIFSISLLLCGLPSFSQIYSPKFPTVYGNHEKRLRADSAIGFPSKDTLLYTFDTSPQIFYRPADSTFYGWSLAKGFFKLGSGGSGTGIDNGSYHTFSTSLDSLYGMINRPNGTKDSIEVVADGLIGGGNYTLPIASASTLGGVKVGTGLSIDGGGILSTPVYTASTGLTKVGNDFQLGGLLSANSIITANANNLTLNGSVNNYTGVLNVNNISSGYAIMATGSGNNIPTIYATSSGVQSTALGGTASGDQSDGVFGSTYNGYGGKFNSRIGVPLYAYRDSGTLGVDPIVQFVKTINQPNQYYATNGMGQSIQFIQSDTNRVTGYNFPILNSLVSSWQDTLTGKSLFYIEGLGNRTTTNRLLSLSGDGKATLNKYGTGTFTGTPTKQLSVTATGDVIETSQPIITSGTAAPTTTPSKVGDIYVDITNKKLYFAAGSSSSSDWTIAN